MNFNLIRQALISVESDARIQEGKVETSLERLNMASKIENLRPSMPAFDEFFIYYFARSTFSIEGLDSNSLKISLIIFIK